jgi:hypothetical protein
MIELYAVVPNDTLDDEDKFNMVFDSFKGKIFNKYRGKEVHIIVRSVRQVRP